MALWALNLGWEGEEGCDKGEILRFFDDGGKWLWLLLLSSCFVVVRMKQPRWTRRMMKRERNLLKKVAMVAITVCAPKQNLFFFVCVLFEVLLSVSLWVFEFEGS